MRYASPGDPLIVVGKVEAVGKQIPYQADARRQRSRFLAALRNDTSRGMNNRGLSPIIQTKMKAPHECVESTWRDYGGVWEAGQFR
jgi:hypothetical protein